VIKVKFEPRDLWIGIFFSANGIKYVCPLPTVLIEIHPNR
jgi:hypothetical protein